MRTDHVPNEPRTGSGVRSEAAFPLQVTFREMDPSPAVEEFARRKAFRLTKFYAPIMKCQVVIEAPHQHRRKGKLYHVRIDLAVRGEEFVVGRSPSLNEAHKDVYVAVRDAFDAARRELEDHARCVRGDVKAHVGPPKGVVKRIFPNDGYGFLEAEDGREIYFHKNAVLEGFEKVKVGDTVRFAEENGEKGPKASTVSLAGG